MPDDEQPDLTSLTVQLLSAYVANNTVASDELAGLIETTRAALAGTPRPQATPEPEFAGAVSLQESLALRDHLISMIDGKHYKTLKRHLGRHGLTPAEYRSRYKLPADYPMVAPGYSETRRAVARNVGLGRKPRSSDADEPSTEPSDTDLVLNGGAATTSAAMVNVGDASPAATQGGSAGLVGGEHAAAKPPSKRGKKTTTAGPGAADRTAKPQATELEGTRTPRKRQAKKAAGAETGSGKDDASEVASPEKPKRGRPRRQSAQAPDSGDAPA